AERSETPRRAGSEPGPSSLCDCGGCSELRAQPDEQGLQRERRRDLELLGLPPGRTHELTGFLGGVHPLESGVRPQLVESVDVDRRRLRARGYHDEVAVPGLELLEQCEQLLPLGAALGAPDALLRLPPGHLEW